MSRGPITFKLVNIPHVYQLYFSIIEATYIVVHQSVHRELLAANINSLVMETINCKIYT